SGAFLSDGSPPARAHAARTAPLPHPRLLLGEQDLPLLRARADRSTSQAPPQTSAWRTLRGRCDATLDGTVEWPDGNRYPGGGNIGEGYQGMDYYDSLLNTSLCYLILRNGDPAARAR